MPCRRHAILADLLDRDKRNPESEGESRFPRNHAQHAGLDCPVWEFNLISFANAPGGSSGEPEWILIELMEQIRLAGLMGIMVISLWETGLRAQPYYVYQGGVLQGTITAYTGSLSGADNYGYSGYEAHLTSGPTLVAGRGHLFLYEGSDGLHFNVVFNNGDNGTAGNADWSFTLNNNDSTASVQVADESSELSGSGGSFSGSWNWLVNYTDGGVIGPLSGAAWELYLTPNSQTLSTLVAYSASGTTISLSTGTGSGNTIKITPVPEVETSTLLTGLALLGFSGWRRWRR